MLVTDNPKLLPRDILVGCDDPFVAQERAMLIALQSLAHIRECRALTNGAEGGVYEYEHGTITLMCREWCFGLADIGTTEAELAQLALWHYRTSAIHILEWLRSRPVRRDDLQAIEARNIISATEKGSFTLADIGTTEEELTRLSIKITS